MSLDLHDCRCKLTPEGWAAVSAKARATGKDQSEVIREIVHSFALEEIRAATLLNAALTSEGLSGIQGERR